jgi:stage V sporulation protein K
MAMDLRRRTAKPTSAQAAAEVEALRQARVKSVLAELDGLIGLAGVKRHVREIYAFQSMGLRRTALGLAHEQAGLHMVFTGNPGTGKTTVARILGRLFKEMGLVSQGHIVEVERADLVGEYIGHTAQKTREVIKRATGGLLFIDEAYSLARGGEKDFGKESIDCLVRAMEEQRGQLVMILAGYPWEMADFLSQNPGLKSRLPLVISFPDYVPEELLAIAEGMWREREYELGADARAYLHSVIYGPRWSARGEEGNARAIRNLVERSLRCHALRLVGRSDLTRAELITVCRSDLEQTVREWKRDH